MKYKSIQVIIDLTHTMTPLIVVGEWRIRLKQVVDLLLFRIGLYEYRTPDCLNV